jgi:hypothetical protein
MSDKPFGKKPDAASLAEPPATPKWRIRIHYGSLVTELEMDEDKVAAKVRSLVLTPTITLIELEPEDAWPPVL